LLVGPADAPRWGGGGGREDGRMGRELLEGGF
jgi:hypothetical protein